LFAWRHVKDLTLIQSAGPGDKESRGASRRSFETHALAGRESFSPSSKVSWGNQSVVLRFVNFLERVLALGEWHLSQICAVQVEEVECPHAEFVISRTAKVESAEVWRPVLIACSELTVDDH
jgi:hypothetical protein